MARLSCCLDEHSEMAVPSPEGNSKIVSSVQAFICAKYYNWYLEWSLFYSLSGKGTDKNIQNQGSKAFV